MYYQNNYNPYKQSHDIQYVNGLESAKAYPMNPNQSVILMDSSEPKFYVKRTDASGFSDVKAFTFTEYKEKPGHDFVGRSEFEDLKAQINALNEKLREVRNESDHDDD